MHAAFRVLLAAAALPGYALALPGHASSTQSAQEEHGALQPRSDSPGSQLVRAASQPTTPKPEVLRRLRDLQAWATAVGDDTAGVERLMAHPSLNSTLNDAVYLLPDGSRFDDSNWALHVEEVYKVHNLQTLESNKGLTARWSDGAPLLGNVSAWDLLKLLHFTIDNTDQHLMYTSQFIHCLQVYRAVKAASASDSRFRQDAEYTDDMAVGALVHDLGKSLSLFGEADGNVDCMNRVTHSADAAADVAAAATGAPAAAPPDGLDAVQFQFNHDRYGHDKLRRNVLGGRLALPPRVLDIVKFHSLRELAAMAPLATDLYRRRGHTAVAIRGLTTLVDGAVVSADEEATFRRHVGGREADVVRAAFVLHFAEFDLHSKNRTDEIPRDVDVAELKQLLRKYTAGDGERERLSIEW